MADWQPLAAARPLAAPPIPDGQTGVTCAECGRGFAPGEVIQLNRSWVCAGCKPVFLQRLREGAMPSAAAGGLWRTGKQLVTRSETPFPDRCVRCNAPANGYRLKRQLYWHPPAYYLFILLNLLIYAIIAICVRKKAIVHIGLCDQHRVRRKWGIVVCCSGVLIGFVMLIGGAVQGSGIVAVLGFLLLVGAAIYGALTGARISPARITKDNVWLKGVNSDYLAELPEWSGP
jgi:DNA-directed RNA polymerase subunit RPC12/RpoP